MKISMIIILALLVLFHAFATLFAFGNLFGMALMHPSNVNHLEKRIWGIAFFILSLPMLWLVSGDNNSLFGTQPYLMSILNSILAICLLYYLYLWCRKRRESLTIHSSVRRPL
jgi:hypothetical protein